MRGGETEQVASILITGKAFAQYAQFDAQAKRGYLAEMLKDVTVRRFADDSPYWIYEADGLRFVFCRKHGRAEGSGAFALVTVQRGYDKAR